MPPRARVLLSDAIAASNVSVRGDQASQLPSRRSIVNLNSPRSAMPPSPRHILFVSDVLPANVRESTHGIFKRMRLFLDACADIAEVRALFFVQPTLAITDDLARSYADELARYWNLRVTVSFCHLLPAARVDRILNANLFRGPLGYRTRGVEQVSKLAELIAARPSAIVLHRLNAASTILRVPRPDIPIFFDMDDVEHLTFFRDIRQPPTWRSKPLLYLQIPAIIALERRVTATVDRTFVCSSRDVKHLSSTWHMKRIAAVPNAVEIPDAYDEPKSPTVAFVGILRYSPNAIAADYLVEKVWPHIRAAVPDATLQIAGVGADRTRSYHQHIDGVQFRGYVTDMAAFYAETAVVCSPILSGGGTRVKIVEAAAFGRAVVSTSFGAQGLSFVDGVDILLRDDAESIATACIQLLTDPALRQRLARAAREKAEQLYDRKNIVASIRATIEAAIVSNERRRPVADKGYPQDVYTEESPITPSAEST
jgi:glycosyltransferase involved in cell wall biosynthesis